MAKSLSDRLLAAALSGMVGRAVYAESKDLRGRGFNRGENVLQATAGLDPEETSRAESPSVLSLAAWHSLAWLFVANLIGVWLAILLLYPDAGRWLGECSYGRWTPVHLNFQLYGWMALPLVAWAIRIYRADRGPIAIWSRTSLLLWSLALAIGAVTWLHGNSSGKLFLDWSGYARIFYPISILFLWSVLVLAYHSAWRDPDNRSPLIRATKLAGLALLFLVPFAIYIASDPAIYPAVNPDTGGPTGASQLESTLIIVLILLLLPYGLARRKPAGSNWLMTAWIIVGIETILCVSLGRQDVSHHRPIQFLSLGSLLVWVPLVPACFNAFQWPRNTRLWRYAVFVWWGLLVPTGWAFFLPGILDRLKFTDGLVGHSIMAMAGFASSLLILILGTLLDDDAEIFNSRWAFVAWHGSTLAYVVLFLIAGWREGVDPVFTIVPGMTRNVLYAVRLVLGLAMTAASAHWLMRLTQRMRARAATIEGQSVPWRATETREAQLR
jgi:cytochrome c oxidase cbb3-type subunit 1